MAPPARDGPVTVLCQVGELDAAVGPHGADVMTHHLSGSSRKENDGIGMRSPSTNGDTIP